MGKMLANLKNVQEANLSDLSTGEKLQRGLIGGLGGGLKGMSQPPMQGGAGAPPIQIGPAPQVDFSQIGRRNPFFGGY